MLRFNGLVKRFTDSRGPADGGDEQWAKITPLIPMNRPGQKPRNNRRILSGIFHVLKGEIVLEKLIDTLMRTTMAQAVPSERCWFSGERLRRAGPRKPRPSATPC
jgi:transposase